MEVAAELTVLVSWLFRDVKYMVVNQTSRLSVKSLLLYTAGPRNPDSDFALDLNGFPLTKFNLRCLQATWYMKRKTMEVNKVYGHR